jgi:hypothetical protein
MTDAGALPRRRSVLPVKGSEGSQQPWNSQRERHRGEDQQHIAPPPTSPWPNCAHHIAAVPLQKHEEETRARCPTAGSPAAELQPRPTPQQGLPRIGPRQRPVELRPPSRMTRRNAIRSRAKVRTPHLPETGRTGHRGSMTRSPETARKYNLMS